MSDPIQPTSSKWKKKAAINSQNLSLRHEQKRLSLAQAYQGIIEDIVAAKLGDRQELTWEEAQEIVWEVAKVMSEQAEADAKFLGSD